VKPVMTQGRYWGVEMRGLTMFRAKIRRQKKKKALGLERLGKELEGKGLTKRSLASK